ncbi:hypothetical protein JZ751_028775 [Albula glossodonta]|uniref:Uncharacterized protein n=1 Tax=Albula glossodonta TaxID=121402 RepID=A0A8T2NAL1_9TELE|nr:hypothetical protein JZ751_028775 [Albula glossodonta]
MKAVDRKYVDVVLIGVGWHLRERGERRGARKGKRATGDGHTSTVSGSQNRTPWCFQTREHKRPGPYAVESGEKREVERRESEGEALTPGGNLGSSACQALRHWKCCWEENL